MAGNTYETPGYREGRVLGELAMKLVYGNEEVEPESIPWENKMFRNGVLRIIRNEYHARKSLEKKLVELQEKLLIRTEARAKGAEWLLGEIERRLGPTASPPR